MTNNENFFNLSNDYFSFIGQKCLFEIQKNSDSNTNSKNVLTISCSDSEKNYFSFSGNNGLCLTTKCGSIIHDNILGKFLSLPSNNAKALLKFFEEYGYFFRLPTNESNIIDFNQLIQITYHIKAALLLMNELQNTSINYEIILQLTLYLLLSPQIKMKISDNQNYTGYHDSVFDTIDSVIVENSNKCITIDDEDYYVILDSIYEKNYNLRVDEYEDISTGETFMYSYPGINDSQYRKITIAYKNCHNVSKIQRLIIDFLFHFMHSNGVIKNVTFDSGIEFYKSDSNYTLDDNMKKGLLLIGKYVLSKEINQHVSKMRPIYNPNTLEPTWKAPNLLTALYFSLFYMKPKSEIYRKCANPSCTNFFLVKTSNSRKKYCCDDCRNASNVRSYRMRQKK